LFVSQSIYPFIYPLEAMATEKKTVVVTGATGQLGRQVVKAFEKGGWEVFGIGMRVEEAWGTLIGS